MRELLWLIPLLPLAGFIALALAGGRLSRRATAAIGCGSVGLSAAVAALVAASFLLAPPSENALGQTLGTWIEAGGLDVAFGLRLDPLSLLMVLVVAFIGFLILVYSTGFMRDDEGYSRFFAYMDLFVAMMLVLVLADNLLLLYLGWEGVGLCSFLLIGFWYDDPVNVRAARKAFIVTRVGDAAMAVGLFVLFRSFGTLDIQTILGAAEGAWPVGSAPAVIVAALLLGGAVGKSAQLPLQTWLPDAMAGPTPVSALIHAATMVTAGVYLIARTHALFALAPVVQAAVALIGAVTLLLAACSALVQRDIKRVLAYSTISQIGYMFLALGVGAWSAAIFHFMTHAFFKALLFLGAGTVILALHHEHDLLKMGGLRKHLPLVFWTFLFGCASLAALPLVTAGFYSKDQILWQAWSSGPGGRWLWAAGALGALLTSVYTFRMLLLAFFGPPHKQVRRCMPLVRPGPAMSVPLVVLAVLSLIGGFVETPRTLGGVTLLSGFLGPVLGGEHAAHGPLRTELVLQILTSALVLAGVLVAYWGVVGRPAPLRRLAEWRPAVALRRLWFAGWGFDWLYDRLLVRPYAWLARANRRDVLDLGPEAVAGACRLLYGWLSRTETGRVRGYAAAVLLGVILIIAMLLMPWNLY